MTMGMPATNRCQIRVGRLLEIDVAAGYRTVADVEAMLGMLGQTFEAHRHLGPLVIAADWRPCGVLKPEVAEVAARMLSSTNPQVERSAILLKAGQATAVMQAMRLVRASHHPGRRLFTTADELRAWLGEVLTPVEQHRLLQFLPEAQAAAQG